MSNNDDVEAVNALIHARAFVPDVQEVINDDAGDDPDPQWVYDRLIESLAVIDNLVEVFGSEYAGSEHATQVGLLVGRIAVAAVAAEAERRWPSYPAVGFSGADDRQRAFRDGAAWALAARGDATTPTEVEWGVRHAEAGWDGSDLDTWDLRGNPYSETTALADAAKREGSRVVRRTVSAWREVN